MIRSKQSLLFINFQIKTQHGKHFLIYMYVDVKGHSLSIVFVSIIALVSHAETISMSH